MKEMTLNDPWLKVSIDRWYTKFPPLTPWFPHDVVPVRVGVYMVDQSWPDQVEQPVFSLWDGNSWYPQGSTPDDALRWVCYGPIKRGEYMAPAFRQWRGLRGEE
jgi:hypothetical protein